MTENKLPHLTALANNKLPFEIESTPTIPLTPKQERDLSFEMRRAQIRVAAQAKIEELKRETFRQKHWRKPQTETEHEEPFFKAPCPRGHSPNYCLNNQCDLRAQCFRDEIITTNSFGVSNTENLFL